MQTAVSAMRTCSAPRSASEYTATVRRPSRRAVRMTRQAISPRLAIRMLSSMGVSHPEDAEGGLAFIGSTRCGCQCQCQHVARIGRVDHAVVPESRAGVEGMPLRFVLA